MNPSICPHPPEHTIDEPLRLIEEDLDVLRYWYNSDTDDYTTSNSIPEAEECLYFGYREVDREEFDAAMHKLKD